MSDVRFYFSRFIRRLHWFLLVAVTISAASVIVALTLPPSYESDLRLIVESKQIPDNLAESTVSTPALEQLQIVQQRLLTRENLLDIANDITAVHNQSLLNPDEIVRAMRAQTRVRSTSGRDAATLMDISFEAPSPQAAAGVLNAYLTLILEEDAEFRTARAVTTMEFFEQQVERLGEDLDAKSREILEFKNGNADALPETLNYRMAELSRLEERLTTIDADIENFQGQAEQLLRLAETQNQLSGLNATAAGGTLTPRQQRLLQLERELEEMRGVYSETNPRVVQQLARIEQLREAIAAELGIGTAPEGEATADDGTAENGIANLAQTDNPMLNLQLEGIGMRVATLASQRDETLRRVEELRGSIARTPANALQLEALERDYMNTQKQYNAASDRLSSASTGERIELLSRGQRITVIEPPAVPSAPTRPNRIKLAGAGIATGILAGLGLVFLLEFLNRSVRRADDIVAHFEVMPIATIPYVRSSRQQMIDRGLKLALILAILVGGPALIYAVHEFYMPLDLVAEDTMNRLGVRW
ncbi:GumC family protein [Tropicimonas aquimaris]|uniref:GumC family protein n=1 Tax=Tropicimonas aquimaris TaxID=914152 RepID=A0ABW3IKJ5_9RHOB